MGIIISSRDEALFALGPKDSKGKLVIYDDVQIIELASRKLVAKGPANHHEKAHEFSHFVQDANPTSLLTHGNEVSRIWNESFGHLKFNYLHKL